MGKEQALLGSGDAHVTEPPLFLQRSGIVKGAIAGEQPLLQTHQAHHRKFQTFTAVQGHQSDAIGGGVLAIGIAGQSRRGQKTLKIPLLVFLLVLQTCIHQLLQVAPAFLRLIAAFGDQFADVATELHHLLNQFRRGRGGHTFTQAVDQLTELQQTSGGTTTEGAHRFGITHHIPEGNAQLIGRIGEPLNRGLADAPLGHIDHAQQTHGVGRVDQQAQVAEHVLDFAPVVEAQTAHHHVGDSPAHQGFLQRP